MCELTSPPTTTAHVARPPSTSSTRSRTSPSSISTSWPGSSTSPITAGAIGSSPSVAASSAQTVIWSPVRRTTGSSSSPMRSFGPCRSAMSAIGRPTSAAISRTSQARSECPSCVPCERLKRTASTPASMSARRRSRDSEAGPSVATIFVRRSIAIRLRVLTACGAGRPPSRGTPPCHQAPPRSGAAGCTSRRGRFSRARRS